MQMAVMFEDFVDWLQTETHIFTDKSFLNYASDSYHIHIREITFFFFLIKSKKKKIHGLEAGEKMKKTEHRRQST